MKVLNSSTVRKTLKVGSLTIIIPPGISEQWHDVKIFDYVSSHPDLSIYTEEKKEEKSVEVKKKKSKKQKKSSAAKKESSE